MKYLILVFFLSLWEDLGVILVSRVLIFFFNKGFSAFFLSHEIVDWQKLFRDNTILCKILIVDTCIFWHWPSTKKTSILSIFCSHYHGS
jgi:hypothetical protein